MGLSSVAMILAACLAGPKGNPSPQGHAKLTLSVVEGPYPSRYKWLMARLAIDPGWHVYWENPGASGIATKLTWLLPSDYELRQTYWPTPKVFHDGGIVNFGYEGEVSFLAALVPAKKSITSKGVIGVQVDWMACKEECVLGSAKATVPMSAVLAPTPSKPKAPYEWSRYPDALPPRAFRLTWAKGQAILSGEVPIPYSPKDAYFFPILAGQFELEDKQKIAFSKTKPGTHVEVRLSPMKGSKPPKGITGVLVIWNSQNKQTSYVVDTNK